MVFYVYHRSYGLCPPVLAQRPGSRRSLASAPATTVNVFSFCRQAFNRLFPRRLVGVELGSWPNQSHLFVRIYLEADGIAILTKNVYDPWQSFKDRTLPWRCPLRPLFQARLQQHF